MRAFVLLLKIQLLGLFGINKALHADAARAKRTIGLVALAVVALVAIVAAYVVSVAETLVSAGFIEYVPLMAVLVGAVAGAVAAFLEGERRAVRLQGLRPGSMSLPVPTATVVLSRIASLYAMGAAFGLLVMVPAFAVYALHAGVSAMGVVCMALAVALAPLAPLALAVVLAALVAAASSRFRHASIFQVVLTMVLLLAFLAVYFLVIGQSGGDVNQLAAMGAQQMGVLSENLPAGRLGVGRHHAGEPGRVRRVRRRERACRACTGGGAHAGVRARERPADGHARARVDSSFEDGRGRAKAGAGARSPFRAMLAKEARLLLATPIYLLNGCMGYVLVVVGAAALLAMSKTGALPLDQLPPELVPLLGQFVPWGLAFCVGIMSTTVASVSLEGSARWIMLTAPVPARTVLASKAALNLAFALPSVVVGGVLVAFAFPLGPVSLVSVFVVPLALVLFSTFAGLALDALRPRYDWTTPYEPVKRGMPVFVVAFGGMVIVGVGFAVTALAGAAGSLVLAVVVATAFARVVPPGRAKGSGSLSRVPVREARGKGRRYHG